MPRESKIRPVRSIKRKRSYVLYGRSGTGKTTLACTFPGPVLLLDCKDEGTDSVADVEDLDVMDVSSTDDLEEAFYLLRKGGKYRTVVIDTLTALQDMAVQEVSKKKDKAGQWGSMTKQQWGDVAQRMKATIMQFRDLPMEVVFIAQDRTFNVDDEASGEGLLDPEVGPRLMPSVASHLNAAVTVVGHTFIRVRYIKKEVNGKKKEVRKTEYCLGLGPHPVYIRKVRKPKVSDAPDAIVDPSYEDILEVITGAENAKEA